LSINFASIFSSSNEVFYNAVIENGSCQQFKKVPAVPMVPGVSAVQIVHETATKKPNTQALHFIIP